MRNNKQAMMMGLGLAGLLALIGGCGKKDGTADCGKAKTDAKCGTKPYEHCAMNDDGKCVPKTPATDGSESSPAGGDDENTSAVRPASQGGKKFTCKQKGNIDWIKLCKIEGEERNDQKKCEEETTFGKNNVTGCKFHKKDDGACAISKAASYMGFNAVAGAGSWTDNEGAAFIASSRIQLKNKAGNYVTACEDGSATLLEAVTGKNDPCSIHPAKAACMAGTIDLKAVGGALKINLVDTALTGIPNFCIWTPTPGTVYTDVDVCLPNLEFAGKMMDLGCGKYFKEEDCKKAEFCEVVESSTLQKKQDESNEGEGEPQTAGEGDAAAASTEGS